MDGGDSSCFSNSKSEVRSERPTRVDVLFFQRIISRLDFLKPGKHGWHFRTWDKFNCLVFKNQVSGKSLH